MVRKQSVSKYGTEKEREGGMEEEKEGEGEMQKRKRERGRGRQGVAGRRVRGTSTITGQSILRVQSSGKQKR